MASIPEAVLAAILTPPNDSNPDIGQPAAGLSPPQQQAPGLDLTSIVYAVHAILDQIGDAIIPVSGLAWEEQAGELGTRITMQIPADYVGGDVANGKYLPTLVPLGTRVTVMAAIGTQDFQEVARGTIEELAPNDGTGGTFEVVAYDPLKNLLNSKVNKIFPAEDFPTPGTIIDALLNEWNVEHTIIPDLFSIDPPYDQPKLTHGHSLADIIAECLQDATTVTSKPYIVRPKPNLVVAIEQLGGPQPTVYWLNQLPTAPVPVNITSVKERWSIVDLITTLTVTGTDSDVAGVAGVVGTIDNSAASYGLRRDDIMALQSGSSYQDIDQVGKKAQDYMNQNGTPHVDRSIDAPDIPWLRKYDQIRISAGTMDDHFVVNGISHSEASRTMTITLGTLKTNPDIGSWSPAENGAQFIPQPNVGGQGGSFSGGGPVTPAQLYALALAAGWTGNDAITAVAISLAEDPKMDPDAKNTANTNGTVDLGLWQINSVHWGQPGIGSEAELHDPLTNAKAGYQIWKAAGGSFQPWSTYIYGQYKSHLAAAQEASTAPKAEIPVGTQATTSPGSQTAMKNSMNGWLNVPYLLGGQTKSGVDCSAFTQAVFKDIGVTLPRTAQSQYSAGNVKKVTQPQFGDLVFFHGTYNTSDYISHVGIVTGPGTMISAAGKAVGTQNYNDSYWQSHLVGFGRVTAAS